MTCCNNNYGIVRCAKKGESITFIHLKCKLVSNSHNQLQTLTFHWTPSVTEEFSLQVEEVELPN